MDPTPKATCPRCHYPVRWLVISLASYVGDLMRTGACECFRTVHVWDGRRPAVAVRVMYHPETEPIRETYEVKT